LPKTKGRVDGRKRVKNHSTERKKSFRKRTFEKRKTKKRKKTQKCREHCGHNKTRRKRAERDFENSSPFIGFLFKLKVLHKRKGKWIIGKPGPKWRGGLANGNKNGIGSQISNEREEERKMGRKVKREKIKWIGFIHKNGIIEVCCMD